MRLVTEDFGLADYEEIWERQKSKFHTLVDLKKSGMPVEVEYLFTGEHLPVYTLGFHGNSANLLVSEEVLSRNGAKCIRIERGGDITYHGPGQLIAYPLIDLENHGLGIKGYMSLLEDTVIDLLSEYGIKGEKVDGATGIWIGKGTVLERKICAMGVKCTRYVTMHGLALNVNTDLEAFNMINPCGFTDRGVTSLSRELGEDLPMDDVKRRFTRLFIRNFNYPEVRD